MQVAIYTDTRSQHGTKRMTVQFTAEERAELQKALSCDSPRFYGELERHANGATLTLQLRQTGGVGLSPYSSGLFKSILTSESCRGLDSSCQEMKLQTVEYIRDARHIVAEIPNAALEVAPNYKRTAGFKPSPKPPAQTPDAKLRAAKNLIESAILEFENSTGGRVNKLLLERDEDGAARVRVGYIPARPVEVEL